MKIRLHIDPKYDEPEVVICAGERSPDVLCLKESIENMLSATVTGCAEGETTVMRCDEVARFYAERDRVYAQRGAKAYALREKLYELEERLDPARFVRISRFEIVNLRRIVKLDTSLTGTIRVQMEGGIQTYVSRRNVARIKRTLGI